MKFRTYMGNVIHRQLRRNWPRWCKHQQHLHANPPSPLLRPFSPLDKVLSLPPALSCILQAERHGLLLVTYQAGDDDYELDLMQSRFTFSIF